MTEQPALLDAVILAGATEGERDPLLEGTPATRKALLPISGKPMVCYVEQALRASGRVARIVAMGLNAEDDVPFAGPVERTPSQGDIFDNILGGIAYWKARGTDSPCILVASSDIPLLTGPVVARFVDACLVRGGDLFYSVVEKTVMEGRFPGSGRSYAHLRDGYYAGGDLFMVSCSLSLQRQQVMRDLVAQRKNAMKMARVLGPGLLIGVALRRFTLSEVERRVSKVLGIEGRGIASPDPELAMDVDKPAQLEMVIRYLERRGGG